MEYYPDIEKKEIMPFAAIQIDPEIITVSQVLLITQSCLTAIPWTVARQVPVHSIFQARILEWVAISSSSQISQRQIYDTTYMRILKK